MVAQLDYSREAPERVASIRVMTTAALQKLLAQLNMDTLLEKELPAGHRTYAGIQTLTRNVELTNSSLLCTP